MVWHCGSLNSTGVSEVTTLTSTANNNGSVQQVVYGTIDAQLHQLWWLPAAGAQSRDLSSLITPKGPAFVGSLTSYVRPTDTLMVVHASAELALREFWWAGGNGAAGSGTISTEANIPQLNAKGLASHYVTTDKTDHVFCVVGVDSAAQPGHVLEFSWRGAEAATAHDLTVSSGGAPLAESDLHSHAEPGTGNQHVFYTSAGHLIEIIHFADGQASWRDLNAATPGAPLVLGRPTGYVSPVDDAHHVYARDEAARPIEFTWIPAGPVTTRNLTTGSGAPASVSELASHLFFEEGTTSHHVFYMGRDRHVREIWWYQGGTPAVTDFHLAPVNAPLAGPVTPIVSHVFSNEHTQHVFYQAVNGQIIELWFVG